MSRGLRIVVVVAVVTLALAGLLVVRHRAVRDLRSLERTYLTARQPTACANAALAPSAFTPAVDQLSATVLELVERARSQSIAIRDGFRRERHDVVPLPSLRAARRALADDLDAQVALYDELVDHPAGSDAELRALGRANNEVERRLGRARRQLLSGATAGWDRRFVCQTSSSSSSSK